MTMTPSRATIADPHRGATIVEAVISMIIVGVMLVAALSVLGAAARTREARTHLRQASALARHLMSEILPGLFDSSEYMEEAANLLFARPYYVPWLADVGEGDVFDTEEAAQAWVDNLPEEEKGWTIEEHTDDIFEHWIVTPWLKDKLREKGQLVEDIHGVDVWARCGTGQAIHLDHYICEIYRENIA